MALAGTLQDFSLTDIFQLISMGRKTGALHVDNNAQKGIIFFDRGEATHSQLDDLDGDKAVFSIFRWGEGNFAFKADEKAEIRTIKLSVQNLIMEATRQIDEWDLFKKLIPSLETVVRFQSNPPEGSENVSLKPEEWKILSHVNGIRDIQTIVEKSGFSEFQTCKIMYGLLSTGLLEIVELETNEEGKIEKVIKQPIITPSKVNENKKTGGLGGLFKRMFGGPKEEENPITTIGSMAELVNAILDEYETPKGLFGKIHLSEPVVKRLKGLRKKFPVLAAIKEKNGRIDVTELEAKTSSASSSQQDAALALTKLLEYIIKDAKKSFSPRSALQRYQQVFDKVFKGKNLKALKLDRIISRKSFAK